jgi:predicted small secreted protein
MLDRPLRRQPNDKLRFRDTPIKPKVLLFPILPFATVLLASTLLLSGCNSAEGVGDDVEEAGEEVQDAID